MNHYSDLTLDQKLAIVGRVSVTSRPGKIVVTLEGQQGWKRLGPVSGKTLEAAIDQLLEKQLERSSALGRALWTFYRETGVMLKDEQSWLTRYEALSALAESLRDIE